MCLFHGFPSCCEVVYILALVHFDVDWQEETCSCFFFLSYIKLLFSKVVSEVLSPSSVFSFTPFNVSEHEIKFGKMTCLFTLVEWMSVPCTLNVLPCLNRNMDTLLRLDVCLRRNR